MTTARPSSPAELGVVVPFLNEEGVGRRVAAAVLAELKRSGLRFELVLVDNGSTDRTAAELETFAAEDSRVRVVREPRRGYGNAIRAGLDALRADVVGWLDGDGQIQPESILELYEALRSEEADFSFGRRERRSDPWLRKVASRGYERVLRWAIGVPIPNVNAKPKLFRRSIYERVAPTAEDWFIDTEMVAGAHRLGARFVRRPVQVLKRDQGASKVNRGVVLEYLRNIRAYRRRTRGQ